MTEHSDPGRDDADDGGFDNGGLDNGGLEDSFDIPVLDAPEPPAPSPAAPGPAETSPAEADRDWTRTDSVRDDPGTLGDEARKLWDAVRDQFVEPILRNYPEAAGHLSSAGLEFASAFRALVRGNEQRWTGKPPSDRPEDTTSDWDGRIVIGEDGSDTDNGTADRPTDSTED